ncbi:hypothetical protein BCR32DRAFT_288444, partial [Anaeromyces robustus]
TIDIQKHGNSKISSRAREAIRFLEQYSIKPTKYLKESDIKDEISESITYYHKHTPSRKYKLLIECIKYFNELAKNEIAQIIDINNNDNETIYPLILVTNNKILTKYRENISN